MNLAYYKKKPSPSSFFIGANTPSGFVSYVNDWIKERDFYKVYILKGGPGTGKSTALHRIIENFGGESVSLLCSFDPDSLDGVILNTKMGKVAVIDGTSPHTADPQYPGACGEIVDFGVCFNADMLMPQKKKIADLCDSKKELCKRGYNYLSAAEEFIDITHRISSKAYLREKAHRCVSRLADELCGKNSANKKGVAVRKCTFALSSKGAVRSGGFDGAGNSILLLDYCDITPLFLQSLALEMCDRGENIEISESPMGMIGEIYIPSCDTLLSPFAQGEYKTVNMKRFISPVILSESRAKLTFSRRCVNMAITSALENFREAGKIHGELEKIYTPAVDFSKIDRICDDYFHCLL